MRICMCVSREREGRRRREAGRPEVDLLPPHMHAQIAHHTSILEFAHIHHTIDEKEVSLKLSLKEVACSDFTASLS